MKKIRVGRAYDNDFVLKDKLAEAYHAELYLDDDGTLEIKDLQSKYGTLINNQKINHGFIHRGDTLQIGFQRFTYDDLLAHFEDDLINLRENSSKELVNGPNKTGEISANEDVISEQELVDKSGPEIYIKNIDKADTTVSLIDHFEAPEVSLAKEEAEIMGITESNTTPSHLADTGFLTKAATDNEPHKEQLHKQQNFSAKPKPKSTLVRLFSILLVITISFWIGVELAKHSAKKEVFEIQKKNIPILNSLNVKTDNDLLFANCNLDGETEKYLSTLSKPAKNNKTLETYLDEFCNLFDEQKNDIDNLIQKLHKRSLGLAFAFTGNPSDQHFWLCVNKDQKFAIMHYLNKRYALNARVSIDAPIHIIYGRDGLNWILLRKGALYPGMPFEQRPSKTKSYYLLHADECIREM
ncbi:MAG: FHA domain-containing protein [Flavobacteriales bacterium]